MGLIKTRIKFLIDFDNYIRNTISDEDIIEYWLMYGLEDGARTDKYLLEEYAKDDDAWTAIVDAFAQCLRWAGKLEF